ncbi:MAG TPA: biotin/lipoyl-containing protein [Bacteroidales bacterium]|nr:biotin/lipoyl-containing protein [Bacteroidales bacterium]
MKKFKFKIRGNSYDVDIKDIEDNIAQIEVNGTLYEVEVEQKETARSKTPKLVRSQVQTRRSDSKIKKSVSSRATSVKAPLPGNIFKILVKEGDEVKKGDKIMIMEAMKMENSVLAEKDGKVRSIKVKEGDTVLQNDVLAEIE